MLGDEVYLEWKELLEGDTSGRRELRERPDHKHPKQRPRPSNTKHPHSPQLTTQPQG